MNKPLIRLFYEVPGQIVHLKKGEYLFHEGDRAKQFFIIRSGLLSIRKYDATGHSLALRLAGASNIVGELPLFEEDNPTYLFNAVATEDSEIYCIDYSVLEKYLERKPALAIAMLKLYAEHMRKQHSKYRNLILYGRKGAFYSTLVRLANSYGVERDDGIYITVTLTNQELAEFAATSRESLNRMMSQLRKSGVVSYENHHIVIHKIEEILQEIDCEHCDRSVCNIE